MCKYGINTVQLIFKELVCDCFARSCYPLFGVPYMFSSESNVLEGSIFNFKSNVAAKILQSIILRDALFHCLSIVSQTLPILFEL